MRDRKECTSEEKQNNHNNIVNKNNNNKKQYGGPRINPPNAAKTRTENRLLKSAQKMQVQKKLKNPILFFVALCL